MQAVKTMEARNSASNTASTLMGGGDHSIARPHRKGLVNLLRASLYAREKEIKKLANKLRSGEE